MRVLICGSRTWIDREAIRDLIRELPYHAVVIHGDAPGGADRMADQEAKAAGLRVEPYPVERHLDGPWPAAGMRRNSRMVKESKPEFCFAFRAEGKSNGIDDMVKKCRKAGVNIHVIREDTEVGGLLHRAFEQLSITALLSEALGEPETTDNGDGTYIHTWIPKANEEEEFGY